MTNDTDLENLRNLPVPPARRGAREAALAAAVHAFKAAQEKAADDAQRTSEHSKSGSSSRWKSSRLHARASHDTLALQLVAGADDDDDIDPGLAAAFQQQRHQNRQLFRPLLALAASIAAIALAVPFALHVLNDTPSRAPVARVTDSGPTKVKPSLSGGKEFANTDKKVLYRLEDDGQPRSAANDRAAEDSNAPRRVRSIPISPPGAGGPSVAAATVPGITLDNVGPAANSAPAAPARVQIPPGPPPQAVPERADAAVPAPPVRVVSAPPPAPPQAQAELPPPPRKVTPAAAPAPQREAALPKPAVAATSSTSGYVAVLSSQKSRMDALKAFADLQQKYGDVLSSKTPDVQEANLGDKGIWYRAVVGPPVSRDAASGICSQLKAAGYVGCWVTAY